MNRPIADLIPNQGAGPSSVSDNSAILSLLGSKVAKVPLGSTVHPDVAALLTEFTSQGLDKVLRKEAIERHPIVQNCPGLQPPTLNTELHSCLDSAVLRQDNYLSKVQLQLATGLSILAIPFDEQFRASSLNNSENNQLALEQLATPLKLFADIFHSLSLHRRHLILPSLEPDVRKVLEDCPLDACLFGQKFTEHLKTSKEARTIGATLKKRVKPTTVPARSTFGPGSSRGFGPGSSRGFTGRTSLNFRRPLAHTRFKKEEGKKQMKPYQQQSRR